jgi:Cu/Ag efflux pump CusA
MKRLIQWSVEHHWLVIVLSMLLLAAGVWAARDMPIDVFPDLTAPTVTVLTEGHGMAPDEMESLVTFPIETAINGAAGVRRVRSATAVGIAVVWVEFDWGTDIYIARQLVAEKLSLVSGTLPPQVERPILAPISSIMGEILFFALSSDSADPLALRTLADTTVRRRLLAVPGVSQVTPIGGAERQFQVIAHPEALRANGIALNELLDAVRGASENASAGIYTEGPQEYVLQAIGRVRSTEEIGNSVVGLRGSRSVLVRDVADVREGPALKRGEGSRNGKPAVIVGVQKQPGANTIEVTERLDLELDKLQGELPRGVTIDRRIFRQSDFIEVAVNNVIDALRDGGVLVILVVLFFLANVRAAAITLTAIPLSLAAAVLVLRGFGATINTMTLGGLAIAIGALVDDAIIDVENVVRRLRENSARPLEERLPAARRRARRHPRNPHLDRLRNGHHRPGVPAGVRVDRRRRAAADAAGRRLHRGIGRFPHRGNRGHAGAQLCLSAGHTVSASRPRRMAGAGGESAVRARPASRPGPSTDSNRAERGSAVGGRPRINAIRHRLPA